MLKLDLSHCHHPCHSIEDPESSIHPKMMPTAPFSHTWMGIQTIRIPTAAALLHHDTLVGSGNNDITIQMKAIVITTLVR